MNAWLDDDPDLPARRGGARLLRASRSAASAVGVVRAARRRSSRSASGSTRSRASTSRRACSSSSRRRGSATCNVSYHVGMFGFSLWLVGLTVVVMAAAIAYAFLAGRDRPRAYYGLMLLLTGAIVGVFTAQDLLALLRDVRGDADPALRARRRVGRRGTARRDVQVRRVHDGGLAADARLDHRARALAGDVRPRRLGHELVELDLPRLRRRVRGQGAALPVPRLAAGRVPRGVAGGRRPC